MPRRERRQTSRVEWNTAARIRFHGARVTLPCVVHNLSNTGARLTAPNIATLPGEFMLLLSPRADRTRDCRIIWRTKSELGVEFISVAPAATKSKPKRLQAAADAPTTLEEVGNRSRQRSLLASL